MIRRRATALVLALGLAGPLVGAFVLTAPAATGAGTGSARTLSGSGEFAGLDVTVSQTQNLVNQVVTVSWRGATETPDGFNRNYLQIMQCWGDGPEPEREQCQFGGTGEVRGGAYTSLRQLSYGSTLIDPLEPVMDPEPGRQVYVPFESVTGVTEEGENSQFFGPFTTNELPYARTATDGTGTEYFEIQTAREAPGLGCGQRLDSGKARSCWLVVVPRGEKEVDGSGRILVDSSPLSASNWKNRIAFPLTFEPIGLSCPVGAAERRLLGNEEVAEAVTRWQPTLCGATGAIFGFSQVNDDLARNKVLDDEPWLSIVGHPLDPATVPEGREVTYAPLTVSGLGIAFNIDRVPTFSAPDAVKKQTGQRAPTLNLNARLLAKLMTQSYRFGSFDKAVSESANAAHLTVDPEFLQLNPAFADLEQGTRLVSVLQPLGQSDGISEIWNYIASDREAAAFMKGKPDPSGMVVNPKYQGIALDRRDFPRNDLTPAQFGSFDDLQALDAWPYAGDMHDAARSTARGDTKARLVWDGAAVPPAWKRSPLQRGGQKAVLGVVDVPTALRFQVPMVALKNAAGEYVTPTDRSLRAGLAQMKQTDVPGVLESNPKASDPDAYPIPVISYAVTSPRELSEEDARDYANFVRYAVTDGQVQGVAQGQLAPGYVPLTAALRKQALEAADLIEKRGGPLPDPEPEPEPTPAPTAGPTVPDAPAVPVDAPVVEPAEVPPTDTPVAGSPVTKPASFATPSDSPGVQRFLLVAVVVLSVIAAASRPLMTWLVSRGGPAE